MITVQNSQLNYKNLNQKSQSFKGIPDFAAQMGLEGLRFLNTNQAVGACVVDLSSMVIPRTAIDAKNRGPQAGLETGFREVVSVINHGAVGLVGLGAATLLAGGLNKQYGTNVGKLLVNNDAIDVCSQYWLKSSNDIEPYMKNVIKNLKGLNGSTWLKLNDKTVSEVYKIFKDSGFNIKPSKKGLTKEQIKIANQAREAIKAKFIESTGAEAAVKLAYKDSKGNEKFIVESLDTVLDTVSSLGRTFKDATENAAKDFDFTKFIDKLKVNKRTTALLGLSIPILVGVLTQPINRYLTKKRTGKDGFVGVDGREADKTAKFKLEKAAIAGGMGLFALKTISGNFANVLQKIQFTSIIPTLDQFKLIYGLTIMSRILSSRDKNELRESTIKDSLGFLNWLILGGMVSKLSARFLPGGKELINYVKPQGEKGIKHAWNWITKASVKTYDEVIKPNKFKNLKELFSATGDVAKQTKIKVGKLALSQVAGYLYSGVVLGVGIAKLNIFITKKINEKKKIAQPLPDNRAKFFGMQQKTGNKIFGNFKGV